MQLRSKPAKQLRRQKKIPSVPTRSKRHIQVTEGASNWLNPPIKSYFLTLHNFKMSRVGMKVFFFKILCTLPFFKFGVILYQNYISGGKYLCGDIKPTFPDLQAFWIHAQRGENSSAAAAFSPLIFLLPSRKSRLVQSRERDQPPVSPLPAPGFIFTSFSPSAAPSCAHFTRKRGDEVQTHNKVTLKAGVYLTWRSARLHSDAEVWTSPPVSSEPAAGRAGLWTPRSTRNSRSPCGCSTEARRWSPSCWAVKRTETPRLRPRWSSCQVREKGVRHGGADRPSAQLQLRRARRAHGAAARLEVEPPSPQSTWTKDSLLPGRIATTYLLNITVLPAPGQRHCCCRKLALTTLKTPFMPPQKLWTITLSSSKFV